MDFLKNIPALPPPEGVVSQFDNPRSQASTLIAVNATFLPLMIIAVVVRLYTRISIANALGWDDYTCIGAALSSTVHSIICFLNLNLGYGSHLWDIRAISLTPSRVRRMSSLSVVYNFAILLTKLSICLLYLRVFGVHPTFRKFVYGGIAFCVIYYTAGVGLGIAQVTDCDGPNALRVSLCAKTQSLTLFQAVLNVMTDLYIFVLPILPITRLKMGRRKKIGVMIIFLSGFIALAVGFVRLVFIGVRLHNTDTLYYAALTSSFSAIEMNVAIITASVLVMPQFFTKSKIFHLSTYSAIFYQLLSRRSNSSHQQPPPKDSDNAWPLVETGILGSIQGDGKFIRTNALDSVIRPMSFSDNKSEHMATRRDLWERST